MAKSLIAAVLCLLLSACEQQSAYDAPTLQRWNEVKAELGPTFAGSPAWQAHMDFVEAGLVEAGVVAVETKPAPYTRWWAADKPSAQNARCK